MTAIQILEKLGANSSMSAADLSLGDKNLLASLAKNDTTFNATLINAPAEEPKDEPTAG
ncbi:MAG: hypothetical protein ACI8R9_000837 [Paraglaciecola sp.]|jgi:hypothetical protein